MVKIFLLLFLLLGFLNSRRVFAVGTEEMQKQIETKSAGVSANGSSITNSSPIPDPSPVIKTENSNFEAKGKITSISGDNFDIEGFTITRSPNYLTLVLGDIEIGKNCEVKGVLEKGLRFAREIRMEVAFKPGSSPAASVKAAENNPANTRPAISNSLTDPTENAKPEVPVINKSDPATKITSESPPPSMFIGDQNVPLPVPSIAPLPPKHLVDSMSVLTSPVISFFQNLLKSWF